MGKVRATVADRIAVSYTHLDVYKRQAPNTAAAYLALFQKLNDYLIFDPLNNKDDVKCFAAVATSLNNTFYIVLVVQRIEDQIVIQDVYKRQ